MTVPHDMQPSKPAVEGYPSSYLRRSVSGFRSWWSERRFKLTPVEVRTEAPAALKDAAVQFSGRVWELAQTQAREQLSAERAAVNERVAEANNRAQVATLARGRAENHAGQLEKKLTAADKTRQDLEKQLSEAAAKHKDLQAQLKAAEQTRAELKRSLEDAAERETKQGRRLAELETELSEHEAKAQEHEAEQRRQLEKARQHYASLESQLGSLLESHKNARQGFDKGR